MPSTHGQRGNMRLYIVGQYNSGNGVVQQRALSEEQVPNLLLSYAYMPRAEMLNSLVLNDVRPRLMIDSGAFTAYSTGRPVSVEAYADWIAGFRQRWSGLPEITFISLDVIGDQGATWRNYEYLSKSGHNVMPVVTGDAKPKDVVRALESPWSCFGGFGAVPKGPQRLERMRYLLDERFKLVLKVFERTGRMPKVHLLGMTKEWAVLRYPAYSVDSSTWLQPVQFGRFRSGTSRTRIPRINRQSTPEDVAATTMGLRLELQHMSRLEAEATALWASRGIVFDG